MAHKSIKERIREAQAKTRHAMSRAKGILGPAKPLAIAGAAGAASDYAVELVADRIDFVKNNWYGRPLALFGMALLVNKKSHTAALGIAGHAGGLARRDYANPAVANTSPYGGSTKNVLGSHQGAAALQDGSEVLYGDTGALQDVING